MDGYITMPELLKFFYLVDPAEIGNDRLRPVIVEYQKIAKRVVSADRTGRSVIDILAAEWGDPPGIPREATQGRFFVPFEAITQWLLHPRSEVN